MTLASPECYADRLSHVRESSTGRVMERAYKLKAQGIDIVDLVAGEPDFNTPENIKEAARRALEANFTRYTPTAGVPALRDAVAARYRQDFGVELARSNIIATVGAKQAIFNTLLALINPGDEVLIPSPYWVTFPQVVNLCEGMPVIVPTRPEDSFAVTAELLAPHITERTKLIVINSPNNPSGAVIPHDEFLRICEMAARHEIYVLSDECYQSFLYDGLRPYTGAAVPERQRRWVIVAGSLSKTYAMTGWRIGYAIAAEELVARIATLQGHQTSNPNSIAQAAAIEALTGPQESVGFMVGEYQRRRNYLIPALNGIAGMRCATPQGAFYAYPDIRTFLNSRLQTSAEFADRLLSESHVAVTPGSAFGTEGFIRLSYAVAYADLEEAVSRLAAFVRKL